MWQYIKVIGITAALSAVVIFVILLSYVLIPISIILLSIGITFLFVDDHYKK